MEKIDHNAHSVYLMYYHLIMVVKYRRKVINDPISERAKEIWEYIAPRYGIVLEEWNHDIDHVHVMFRAQPKTELSKFINAYKSASSRLLKKEYPEIREKQKALESQYKTFVEGIDSGAKALFDKDRAAAIEFLTDFSCNTGNHLVDTWRDFYGYLFCRYMDGNIKTAVPGEKNPKVEQPQLPEWYLRTIIEKAGDKLQVIE